MYNHNLSEYELGNVEEEIKATFVVSIVALCIALAFAVVLAVIGVTVIVGELSKSGDALT